MKALPNLKVKKAAVMFTAAVFALAIPFSSAFAKGTDGSSDRKASPPNGGAVSAGSVTITHANQITPFGAGEWDYLGTHNSDSSENPSNYVYSGGGNFKYKISSGPSGGAWYELMEYDPDNADDPVYAGGYNWFYLYPGDTITYYNIGSYVDGSNKKAEFYVYETFSGHASIQFWD
ncbi:hypothetical protein [Paenibacillus humicola]|uniref:hypothetical protein n=1 Tax=Paenibacillus humicola TaxID=3110540 RepID=UPI00237B9107|nr:hypothetical protein [Paenibacillus humicola]